MPQRKFANQKALIEYAEQNGLVYVWACRENFSRKCGSGSNRQPHRQGRRSAVARGLLDAPPEAGHETTEVDDFSEAQLP